MERSQTTFLSPDGFVQAPRNLMLEHEVCQQLGGDDAHTLFFLVLDIFISPLLFVSNPGLSSAFNIQGVKSETFTRSTSAQRLI